MYFVLMPDSLSSAWARQQLAAGFGLGVRVGSFTALLDVLATSALLAAPTDDFDKLLREQAIAMEKAFWASSLLVDELSTLADIKASLLALLDALPLGGQLAAIGQPAGRVDRYFNDLVSLHENMGCIRPVGQCVAGQWLQLADQPMLEPITLVYLPSLFRLCPWQQQLVDCLAGRFPADAMSRSIEAQLQAGLAPSSKAGDLAVLADGLFGQSQAAARSGELHIIACRDALEEAEVICGMVQDALSSGLAANDVAVVVPSGSGLMRMLPDLLLKAGIQSSQARPASECYQWDVQLIRDLLQLYVARSDASPGAAMLMGTILVNPLMPWSVKTGQYYFSCYQRGDLAPERASNEAQGKLLALLFAAGSQALPDWLGEFAGLLSYPFAIPVFNARSFAGQVAAVVATMELYTGVSGNVDIARIIRQLQPHSFALGQDEARLLLNGVMVLEGHDYLLMPVKHLFIAGFNQGHYQMTAQFPGVFDRAGWQSVSCTTGLACYEQLSNAEHFKTRFSSLLGQAMHGITITLSRQADDGSRLLPSETLLDIARVFQPAGHVEPLAMLTPVAETTHPWIARAEVAVAESNAVPALVADLGLGIDLTGIRCDREGTPRPESPSGIERMMVSPLAWLLDRAGLLPAPWEADGLDPAVQGNIAHKVFELQLSHKTPFDPAAYPALFAQAISQVAPFLNDPVWRMERLKLCNDIRESLVPFMAWCEEQGWQLLHAEQHLHGEQFDIAVNGYADAIFSNGRGEVLVLDYKFSRSEKFSCRMNTGYDLQTMLYRKMYSASADCKQVANGYFALRDRTLVLDRPGQTAVGGISQAVINTTTEAQSAAACEQVNQRLGQLRQGIVMLNTALDGNVWQARGYDSMKYWMDASPLLAAFIKPPMAGEGNDE